MRDWITEHAVLLSVGAAGAVVEVVVFLLKEVHG